MPGLYGGRTAPRVLLLTGSYGGVMSNLELYTLPGCPFCAKVERKLEALGLEYTEHEVPRSHSKRTEVKEVSGQTGVPVLVDDERGVEGMPESTDIVAYLEQYYADQPSDGEQANA